jgi:hypothetical protein
VAISAGVIGYFSLGDRLVPAAGSYGAPGVGEMYELVAHVIWTQTVLLGTAHVAGGGVWWGGDRDG